MQGQVLYSVIGLCSVVGEQGQQVEGDDSKTQESRDPFPWEVKACHQEPQHPAPTPLFRFFIACYLKQEKPAEDSRAHPAPALRVSQSTGL